VLAVALLLCCSYYYYYYYYNIKAKAALKFESETWVLKKREEQRLEAAQMEYLRLFLGITKLGK
jgi:hypothetical protein